MELSRAGGGISWGGGEGGDGAACVAGEADGFEIGHFRCGVCGGARDCSFEEGDAVGRERVVVFRQPAIGLKNDGRKITGAAAGKNAHGDILSRR